MEDVVVGYLVTLEDGYECRLGPDVTRAQNYAVRQHARLLEPMFVRRGNPCEGGNRADAEGGSGAAGGPLAALLRRGS